MPTRRIKRIALAQLLGIGCAVVLGACVVIEHAQAQQQFVPPPPPPAPAGPLQAGSIIASRNDARCSEFATAPNLTPLGHAFLMEVRGPVMPRPAPAFSQPHDRRPRKADLRSEFFANPLCSRS